MDAIFRDRNGNTLATFELTPGEGRPVAAAEVTVDAFDDIIVTVDFEEEDE